MVAEHAFNDPREEGNSDEPPEWIKSPDNEEDEAKFIGDIMPVDFGARKKKKKLSFIYWTSIKAEIVSTIAKSQNQVKMEMMTNMDLLNGKLTADMVALNSKSDAIKAAQDLNDNYIKRTVDMQIKSTWDTLTTVTEGINQMNVSLTQMYGKLAATDAAIAATTINPPPGLAGPTSGATVVKGIMENKAVQNLEKLTSAPGDWMIWQLRLLSLKLTKSLSTSLAQPRRLLVQSRHSRIGTQ